MQTLNSNEISPYLKELVQNSPSSNMKLLDAWDTLSAETQIQILYFLKEKISKEVINKALESENPYIRYMAVKNLFLDKDRDKELLIKIENDNSPLVKYIKNNFFYSLNPKDFLDMPHAKRLIILSTDNFISGEEFSILIKQSLKDNRISNDEISDLVREYINNPSIIEEIRSETWDGESSYIQGKNFKALWELSLELPKNVVYDFITILPTSTGDGEEIPIEILKTMDPHFLSTLLYREDAKLTKFRKSVFFSKGGSYTEECRSAAISNAKNFNLTYDEFKTIIKENSKGFKSLISSSGLRLVFLYALEDIFNNDKKNYNESFNLYMQLGISKKLAIKKLLEYPEYKIKHQLCELAIYDIAKQTMPRGENNTAYLPENLKRLERNVVPGDVWATFINFYKILNHPSYRKMLLRCAWENHSTELPIAAYNQEELFEEDWVELKRERLIEYFIGNKIIPISNCFNKIREEFKEIKKFFWKAIVIFFIYEAIKIFF